MKYVVKKEAVHEGKIVTVGSLVEGKDLDTTYPAIFRKASATESLSKAEAQAIANDKSIAHVVAEVKKQVLAEVKETLTAEITAKVLAEVEAKKEETAPTEEGNVSNS